MAQIHKCSKDVHGNSTIYYKKATNTWWMELGFDSCAVEYCPFCGKQLREEYETIGLSYQDLSTAIKEKYDKRRKSVSSNCRTA